ncbi:hypothetical protein EVAR_87001_1 [Eumeta japonica]|uniref:Uncharacterized protein n=1 Tax=Eumeta variegata TaxID=151549 RepID=A0A4C1W5X8_EUMVA|nr:hypothetical protein EVAR_87001_1 [Eumeta japonica]
MGIGCIVRDGVPVPHDYFQLDLTSYSNLRKEVLMDKDMHHVLRSCPLYDDLRNEILGKIEMMDMGPTYYTDLISTLANLHRFQECARAWHRLRGGLK